MGRLPAKTATATRVATINLPISKRLREKAVRGLRSPDGIGRTGLTKWAEWDKLEAYKQMGYAMKKRLFTLFAITGLAGLVLVGCSNSKIDTAKVRLGLQSIDDSQKAQLETALTAIDAGKYKEAYPPLREIAYGAKLNQNQRKIVQDTMEKVRAKIATGQ
jgi:hypothetical protein